MRYLIFEVVFKWQRTDNKCPVDHQKLTILRGKKKTDNTYFESSVFTKGRE